MDAAAKTYSPSKHSYLTIHVSNGAKLKKLIYNVKNPHVIEGMSIHPERVKMWLVDIRLKLLFRNKWHKYIF